MLGLGKDSEYTVAPASRRDSDGGIPTGHYAIGGVIPYLPEPATANNEAPAMNQAGVNFVKFHPDQFFAFLKENNYPVYHRSPIFFRDFQYGLWRFLQESQTKVPYADIERVARDVIEDFESRGLVRKISRQNYELRMPEFTTVFPTAAEGKVAPAPPKAKPAPASTPAATQPPAAAPAAAPKAAPPGAGGDDEKARKIAELQAKMAAAKAAKEGSAAPAPAAPAEPAPPPAAAAPAAPAATPAAPAVAGDKAAKLAELQAKMAEAKRRREEGLTEPNSPAS
jgi:hypothetical protein